MAARPVSNERIDSIGIDWGTTNARAYALDAAGGVVGRREAALGILNVADRQFDAAFDELVGDWLTADAVPVLMSGMIGSRHGWVEAAYVPCPADPAALADHLMAVPGRASVKIVPGICLPEDSAHRDVMRGEDVQCFGALSLANLSDAVICLPGTHSKWVSMEAGRLVHFATSMTGEAYAVMRRHSILGALMTAVESAGSPADAAFLAGVDRSGDAGGLLNHLFSVRADGLFDVVPAEGLAAYLSGILIGHEVRAMSAMLVTSDSVLPGPVMVVGGGALTSRYALAFDRLGLAMQAVDAEQATVAGLTTVRRLVNRPARPA